MGHLPEKQGPQKAITIRVIIPIVTMGLPHQTLWHVEVTAMRARKFDAER